MTLRKSNTRRLRCTIDPTGMSLPRSMNERWPLCVSTLRSATCYSVTAELARFYGLTSWEVKYTKTNSWLSQPSKQESWRDLRRSGILRCVECRRFGTTYRSRLQGSKSLHFLTLGQIRCPETSVRNYHSTLRLFQTTEDLIYIMTKTWNHARSLRQVSKFSSHSTKKITQFFQCYITNRNSWNLYY
jgi:hypothetical protein